MTTTLFATDSILGVDFNEVYTAPDGTDDGYLTGDQPPFDVGTRIKGSDGSEWLYVHAAEAITGQGYVCVIDESFEATLADTSNEPYGDICGVPAVAAADDDYFWVQVLGPCVVRVAASANPNVDLVPTATGGELDDGVTTGKYVRGLVLTTANGGSAGTAAAMLNYPVIDTLYEPET